MSCAQRRRVGVAERRLREPDHQALERGRVVRHLERLPVRLGLHPRARRDSRAAPSRAGRRRRRAARAAPLRARPCRRGARVVRMRIHAPGIANSANQPSPFGRWRCEWCASSCASTTFCSSSANGGMQHRVPEDDAPRRPEAVRVRVRLLGVRADLLDADRDVADAELRLVLAAPPRASAGSSRAASVVKSRYGATNVKSAAIATKTAAPGSHQRSPSQRASPMTMRSANADREELRGEERPVLEQPVEVAEVGLVVAPLPTSARRARTGA